VKEVELRLQELEGKYSDLSTSYEALQSEYATVKQELERLSREEKRQDELSARACSSDLTSESSYHVLKDGDYDCSLFDESLFCFDADPDELTMGTKH